MRDAINHDVLRRVLSEYADALVNGDHDVGDVLFDLSDQCLAVLDIEGAGVSLADGDGALRFLTATDGRADRVEQAQLAHQDGPCLTAFRTGKLVTVDDLAQDDRWPEYREVALDVGYHAVIGVPMPVRDDTIGALDLYRGHAGPWPPEVLDVATTLSNLATGYVTMSRVLDDARVLSEQLQHALDARVVIEQAKGVLAGQYDISPSAAYERLRSYTRQHRLRVREVARRIVDGTLVLPEE